MQAPDGPLPDSPCLPSGVESCWRGGQRLQRFSPKVAGPRIIRRRHLILTQQLQGVIKRRSALAGPWCLRRFAAGIGDPSAEHHLDQIGEAGVWIVLPDRAQQGSGHPAGFGHLVELDRQGAPIGSAGSLPRPATARNRAALQGSPLRAVAHPATPCHSSGLRCGSENQRLPDASKEVAQLPHLFGKTLDFLRLRYASSMQPLYILFSTFILNRYGIFLEVSIKAHCRCHSFSGRSATAVSPEPRTPPPTASILPHLSEHLNRGLPPPRKRTTAKSSAPTTL